MKKERNQDMTKHDDIQLLVNRFFDGDTSLKEEQEIYHFFACHKSLPTELEQYRELFSAFDALSAEDIDTPKPQALQHHHRRTLLYAITGIAATLLLYIGISTAIQAHEDHLLAKTYEGSYVIVNGQRITDLSRIRGDIEKALCDAKTIESEITDHSVVRQAEKDILDNAENDAEKARIEQILNE